MEHNGIPVIKRIDIGNGNILEPYTENGNLYIPIVIYVNNEIMAIRDRFQCFYMEISRGLIKEVMGKDD